MKKTVCRIFWMIGMVSVSFIPDSLYAHEIPISELNIISEKSMMHLELLINTHEIKFMGEMDENENGKIESRELEKCIL